MFEKTCEECGKTMSLTTKQFNRNQKFCGYKCATAHTNRNKKTKIEKVCLVCGKLFEIRHSWADTAKCCSFKCSGIWRKTLVGNLSPRWKGGEVKKNCEYCGKEFTLKPSLFVRRFCSRFCYVKGVGGEKSHAWQGGKSFEPYPTTFNREFKKLIRERDKYTCLICKQYGRAVHHINYIKMDTTPENCVTLCQSCHAKTNSNREYWIIYFRERNQVKT